MDKKILADICTQIYQQFPILNNTSPQIRTQPHDSHLLIFSSSGMSVDRHTIPFIVRVLVDQDGKIVKTTVSR